VADLTLHHVIPRDMANAPRRRCVWCGGVTIVMTETPFRPDLGALPLMITCGVDMRDAYKRVLAGRTLTAEQQEGVARLAALEPKQIEAGS
jgi:hypothetical protein